MSAAAQAVDGQLVDVLVRGFASVHVISQYIAHDGLDGLAILRFVGMESGEDRGFLVKGECRSLRGVRHAGIKGVGIRSVGLAVCFQKLIDNRRRFEGVNRRIGTAAHHKQ